MCLLEDKLSLLPLSLLCILLIPTNTYVHTYLNFKKSIFIIAVIIPVAIVIINSNYFYYYNYTQVCFSFILVYY